ncbi:MAG: hypothetical protein HFH32_12830 [Eubacterium sp.]|jgi:hypothetical protein|nr:hypothetical protein [Eubacterium sp.]
MNKKKSALYFIPVILLLTVVPLIVRMYSFKSGLAQFDWSPASDETLDFFLYYKSLAITVIAAAMSIILAVRYFMKKKEFKFCYEMIPIIIYAALTFLSSIFSQYRYFSFHGAVEVFETVWVLLGYCVIAFYAYQLIDTFEDLDCIMKWMTVGVALMLVIGMLQVTGRDFYTSEFGKKLVTGGMADIDLAFEKGRVFLGMYNPNYVASYFALIIPMEIALLIQNKKWYFRILYAGMLVLSIICLLASGNRSAIAAFAVTILFILLLFNKRLIKAWKIVLPVTAVIAVVFGTYLKKDDFIIQKFVRLMHAEDRPEDPISEIVTGDNDVAITCNGQVFHAAYDITPEGYINMTIQDDAGTALNTTVDEATFTYAVQDERFPGFTVQAVNLNNEIAMGVFAGNVTWYFKKGDDGTYYYYNVYGRWDKINNAPRVWVNFLEKRFEERGTIWSKTIPLLKNCLIFGTGADTYTVVYPQDDYVDKTYDYSTSSMDVKPHCLYLQIAVQSGIPALLAVLVFYIWYFVTGVRLYAKASYQDGMEIIGAGLLLATFTYMVISFLNDSTVTVAPIFWIMMGLGIAVNEILKKKGAGQGR